MPPPGGGSDNAAMYKEVPFDAQRDLIPITRVSDQPSIIVSHPSLAAKTLTDLIALARAQPGKLTYGSAGIDVVREAKIPKQ